MPKTRRRIRERERERGGEKRRSLVRLRGESVEKKTNKFSGGCLGRRRKYESKEELKIIHLDAVRTPSSNEWMEKRQSGKKKPS